MNYRQVDRSTLVRTLIVLGVIVLAVIPYLIYSLYKVQVTDAAELQEKAIAQQTRDMLISPNRGVIYDANMIPLAVSATVETIVVSPAEITGGDEECRLLSQGLSELLGVDYDTIYKHTQRTNSYYEIIARKVDKTTADKVREFKTANKLNSIKLFEDSKRYYPYSTLLSSVLGFTDSDNNGQYGLELKYNEILKGVVGRIITAKNNEGSEMPFYFEQYFDATDGTGLVLTIDYGVQEILEKHLEVALEENGCSEGVLGIVMEPKTGKILAMAQKGDYDLNSPRTITDQAVLDEIAALPEEEQSAAYLNAMMEQWRNKAIQEPYEPGSVFKVITASIAIEENIVTDADTFTCPGYTTVDGTRISCWKTVGHGTQNFAKALQNSCNVAFINIGLRIGAKTFYSYFKAYGLTEKTGIDMMGEVGVTEGVHYHSYSVFSNPKLGGNVTLATYSFGQTFKVTPIQMITAFCAAMNGGYLMKPYVVSALADTDGNIITQYEPTVVRQVVSEATSKKLASMVESVVSEGTGNNAYVPGLRVGGKTGTSEKRDKSIAEGKDYYIASFLGVAPCDDPQVAVLILLDEPTGTLHQGGQIAGPVVGRIMKDLMSYLEIKAVYSSEDLADMAVEVPLTVGGAVSWAKSMMSIAGFDVKVVGTGDKVTAQYPHSGTKIPNTATVILYCGEEPDTSLVKVPNLIGLTYEKARKALEDVGLYISVGGALGSSAGGTDEYLATHQSADAESDIAFGSVVTVEFYSSDDTGD